MPESAWTRHGECDKCGWCCHSMGTMEHVLPPDQVRDPAYFDAHGYKTDPDGTRRKRLQLYDKCGQLVPADGEATCAIFETRPAICHNWPTKPEDMLGITCSYYFEQRQGDALIRWGGSTSPYPGLKVHANTERTLVTG